MNPALRDILFENSAAAPAFKPSDISGLAAWYDAADSSTITLDGSNNVSQWNDKSGNSRNLTQSDTLKRPGFTSGDGLQFSSAGFSLANATSVSFTAGTSIFVAFRPTNVSTYSSIGGGDGLMAIGGYQIGTSSDGSAWGRYFITKSSIATSFFTGMNYIAIGDRIYSVVANSTDTRGRIIGATTQNQTIAAMIGSSGSAPAVGAFPRGNMVIREIIAYNVPLSDTDRTSVESYLAAKWTT